MNEYFAQLLARFLLWIALLFGALGGAEGAVPQRAAAFRPAIVRSAQFHFGIPAPVPALAAQVMQESAFDPNARSPAGAAGLAQFMPATAKRVGEEIGAPAAPLSPGWAIYAQHYYMAHLLDSIDYPRECDQWGAALSSYNGGLRWHDRRREIAKRPNDFWNSVRVVNPGITAGNQRENEDYPVRVLRYWQPQFASWGGRLLCQQPI